MFYRTGQQRQSPDSTHSLAQPPPPYQSPPLQSLDLDFSQQQPGPSGLQLKASPPNQSQGPLQFPPASNTSEEQLVPNERGRSGGNGGDISSGPLFQIPPSQDVLAQTSTQDISTGFSQIGECTCTCTTCNTVQVHVYASSYYYHVELYVFLVE